MALAVDAPPSRRIKELEVMVADVLVETPDTSTLVFFTGNDLKTLGVPNARIAHVGVTVDASGDQNGVGRADIVDIVFS